MESKFTFNSTTRYIYHCNTCQHNLICYSDERLEKEQRPTPFTATCPYCKGTMYDSGIYQNRRKKLFEKLKNNSIAILHSGYHQFRTADSEYPFVVNNKNYYLR